MNDGTNFTTKVNATGYVFNLLHDQVAVGPHPDEVAGIVDDRGGIDIPVEREWPKGCVWTLETDNTGEIVRARYTPPPPA